MSRHSPPNSLIEAADRRGAAPAAPSRWLQRPVLARHADRDLGAHLDKELRGLGAVLHDVRFPPRGGRVDHLVVAPSGIWIIDSMQLSGRVERRDHGSRRYPEPRMYLDGVERMDLVDELGVLRQAHASIRAFGFGDVPTHRVVCLIDAVWPLLGRPFDIGKVTITWPRALTDKIRSTGLMPIRRANDIADTIRDRVGY